MPKWVMIEPTISDATAILTSVRETPWIIRASSPLRGPNRSRA
jgi:hypothetical protein